MGAPQRSLPGRNRNGPLSGSSWPSVQRPQRTQAAPFDLGVRGNRGSHGPTSPWGTRCASFRQRGFSRRCSIDLAQPLFADRGVCPLSKHWLLAGASGLPCVPSAFHAETVSSAQVMGRCVGGIWRPRLQAVAVVNAHGRPDRPALQWASAVVEKPSTGDPPWPCCPAFSWSMEADPITGAGRPGARTRTQPGGSMPAW